MEIRTLRSDERESLLELLDQWELPDGWRGRDFFRRYIECDPTYRDENVWVAEVDGRLVSCVQIFPRLLRVLDHDVPTGGIGSVFTHPHWRRSGLAGSALTRAVEAMVKRGMELSLLFTTRSTFYEQHGWHVYKSHRTVLRWSDRSGVASPDPSIEVAAFRPEADMKSVREVHLAYSVGRTGATARDDALWQASLALAGNPKEEFKVARVDGEVVAYVRAALLDDVFQVTELGRMDHGAKALATLVVDLMQVREPDLLVPPGKSSRELRSFVILPTFDDIPLTVNLEEQGVASHPVEDPTAMLRCIDPNGLAQRLGASRMPGEEADRFLSRLLPRDGLVFWPADRF